MKSNRNILSPNPHGPHRAVLATAALLLGGLAFLGSERLASAQPAIPAGAGLASWQDNGHDGKYLLKVTNGAAPAEGTSTSGVVLIDTACEPDAEGMNHCRNGIRQANGMTIYVINNHKMGRYRCLQPGETVSLAASGSGWVVATIGGEASPH